MFRPKVIPGLGLGQDEHVAWMVHIRMKGWLGITPNMEVVMTVPTHSGQKNNPLILEGLIPDQE